MKRKTMILIISSLSTAGLLGMGAGVVTNTILSSHANNRSVGAGVQLSTVITVTNLGSVYWGKTITPTARQLNSILKINNNADGSKDANWHPNQWTFNNVTVNASSGAGTATVQVVSWSPDYDTTSGNSIAIQWQQNEPTTPVDLNTAFGGSDNVVNLNSTGAYNTWLMTQNAASVANIKGVANQTALLKWLDASNLYNGNLDINQITIDTAVSGTGLQWNDSGSDINSYTVTLIPIANSNMYTGTIKVKFNVGRIDFNLATIIEMDAYYGGSLPENPTNSEIFNWFIYSNATPFGSTTNIEQTDVDFGTYSSGSRTLTVNVGNEYWTGNRTISYDLDPAAISLETAVPVDSRILAFNKKPTFADFMQALDGKLTTSIVWDAITLPCDWSEVTTWNSWLVDGTYTLMPKGGNLYYIGSVTITWSTSY